jgi:hypothetical protein
VKTSGIDTGALRTFAGFAAAFFSAGAATDVLLAIAGQWGLGIAQRNKMPAYFSRWLLSGCGASLAIASRFVAVLRCN